EGAADEQAVAVAFAVDFYRGAEGVVEAEFGTEVGELVFAAGALPAAVEFLERDDVGIEVAQHAGDAVGREASVEAFAVVDVVGDDAEVGGFAGGAGAVDRAGRAAEVGEGGFAQFAGAHDVPRQQVRGGGREDEQALGLAVGGAAVRSVFVGKGTRDAVGG